MKSVIPIIKKILRSGWFILFSASIGVMLGLYFPKQAEFISPVGKIYISILTMCILPILLATISVSIAHLIHNQKDSKHIKRLLIVFVFGVLVSSTVGVFTGSMMNLTEQVNSKQLTSLGSIVRDSNMADVDINIYEPEKAKQEKAFFKTFIESMIPENIFSALNAGSSLKVLFFSILFGLAVGSISKTTSHALLTSLESVSLAFGKVIQWLMYMLPFGLISLIAQDVTKVGLNALIAMMGFIPFAIVGVFLLFIVSSIIFYIRTGSFIKPNSELKESMYIALGTGNAFACLESSRIAMRDKLGYRERDIDLLVPLTFTICRTGPTLYFSLATMFVAHLYDVEISYTAMFTVIIFSILAGLATAGSSGATIISMISIVLTPLDLPAEAIFVLLSVIDPILGPMRVFSLVHTSCALITLILPKHDNLLDHQDLQPVEVRSYIND